MGDPSRGRRDADHARTETSRDRFGQAGRRGRAHGVLGHARRHRPPQAGDRSRPSSSPWPSARWRTSLTPPAYVSRTTMVLTLTPFGGSESRRSGGADRPHQPDAELQRQPHDHVGHPHQRDEHRGRREGARRDRLHAPRRGRRAVQPRPPRPQRAVPAHPGGQPVARHAPPGSPRRRRRSCGTSSRTGRSSWTPRSPPTSGSSTWCPRGRRRSTGADRPRPPSSPRSSAAVRASSSPTSSTSSAPAGGRGRSTRSSRSRASPRGSRRWPTTPPRSRRGCVAPCTSASWCRTSVRRTQDRTETTSLKPLSLEEGDFQARPRGQVR